MAVEKYKTQQYVSVSLVLQVVELELSAFFNLDGDTESLSVSPGEGNIKLSQLTFDVS